MSQNLNSKMEALIAKEDIRELGLLYSRGVDRKDPELLRDLYTEDATDTHGDTYNGDAKGYVDFLEQAFNHLPYSGHHICNHTIAVDGDNGEGEVYALAYHIFPDGKGGYLQDFMCVRYLDKYKKCADNRWRFSQRVVTYDLRTQGPIEVTLGDDTSTTAEFFNSSLFARGARG